MKNQIAELFGVIVKFDGGKYVMKDGKFLELN